MAENSVKVPFPTHLLDEKLAQRLQRSERDRQTLLQTALDWLEQNADEYISVLQDSF